MKELFPTFGHPTLAVAPVRMVYRCVGQPQGLPLLVAKTLIRLLGRCFFIAGFG